MRLKELLAQPCTGHWAGWGRLCHEMGSLSLHLQHSYSLFPPIWPLCVFPVLLSSSLTLFSLFPRMTEIIRHVSKWKLKHHVLSHVLELCCNDKRGEDIESRTCYTPPAVPLCPLVLQPQSFYLSNPINCAKSWLHQFMYAFNPLE